MNRISVFAIITFLVSVCSSVSAEEISPDQMRRLVSADIKAKGAIGDSVGMPLRVRGYGEKFKDFLIVPVLRGGMLTSVYRDDPKHGSVSEIYSKSTTKSLKIDLFSTDGSRREMERQGVVDPTPKLICVGPISLLGALTAGWYHDTGDSFVLLSLSGRLVTESDIARYWPEHLEDLRAVGR